MRRRLLLLACIALTPLVARAQTQSVIAGTTCSSSCLFVNADPNLGGPPGVIIGCSFADPVPIGATVRSIRIDRNFSQPFAGQNSPGVSVAVNSQAIASATINNVAACGNLVDYSFSSTDYFLGFPGYVYGGLNTIFFDIAGGAADAGFAQALITYDTDVKSVTTTGAEPIIPTDSGLVNDCLQFQSTLGVFAFKGLTGVAGVAATVSSDRNATTTVDVITQPPATDGTGHAIGYFQTRRLGTIGLSTTAASFPSSSSTLLVQEANFQPTFLITAYYTPREADYNGKDVTACGVSGTFKAGFLKEIKIEGSGIAVDGRVIAYNKDTACYEEDTCPRTSSGPCATDNHTAAISPNVMEFTTNFNIANVGDRTAEDIGDLINNYHIDNYVDTKAAYKKWNNIKAAKVRYLSGGGQCSN
ncbi:MAG TPA: hypothetical protein VGR95_18555 [Thermoanaerobaculia bacterium]|nr:hypothetical protein [Thermoanaerobaculia bacterium]